MEGVKFLETLDYPNPLVTHGRHDVTNVPAPALTLLNEPSGIRAPQTCAGRPMAR